MRRFWISAVLLGCLAVLLYAPTGNFEFLRLDDHDYTFRCAFVFDGLSWANVKEAFSNFRHAGVWMPLTYISYMADISMFGPAPGPHHLANTGLHALNTLLLLALAWRLAKGRRIGWITLAVAFWALHPQRVEAVAWIASRKELLWACFALLGLLCWPSGARQPPPYAMARRIGTYVCCAFACMSKPTAMCFPLLALCMDMMNPRETATHEGTDPKDKMRELCSRTVPYLPLIAMALATGALAAYSQTHAEGYEVRELFGASFAWRMLNAAVATGLYLSHTFIPTGIHIDYRAVPGQFPLHGTLGLATLGAWCMAIGAWYLGRRTRARGTRAPTDACTPETAGCGATSAMLWFLAALLPTLGIFGSFGEHARADRFLYVPAMAIVLAAAAIPCAIAGKRARRTAAIVLGTYVLATAVSSWPAIESYRNDYSAFSRTLEFDPDNGRALAHAGQAECAQPGGIDKGIAHLRRSQALRPRDDTASQLAYALAMRGHSDDFAEIRRLCSKFACDHRLDLKGQALEALGMTALRQRRWNEAISCLEDSIRAPRRFYSAEDASLKLASAYCNAGRVEDAKRTLKPLTQSRRADIQGKARLAIGTLKRNPRAVLLLD